LPDGSILGYTDGGCGGNGAGGKWGKAGWGAWVCEKDGNDTRALADMWGPVGTRPLKSDDDAVETSEWSMHCKIGPNNTGELCAMAQMLLWSKWHGGSEPLALVFDSMYAWGVTSGDIKPKKNCEIGRLCNQLYIA
jgi:ribonuclease HI